MWKTVIVIRFDNVIWELESSTNLKNKTIYLMAPYNGKLSNS